MVTEYLIRKKFVHDTMTSAVTRMYQAWRQPISLFKVRTGQLQRFASQGAANRRITETAYELRFFLPLHLRFLDIQYRKAPRAARAKGTSNLYNKLVWPILYKNVFPQLRYGFTDEVRKELRNNLKRAVEI